MKNMNDDKSRTATPSLNTWWKRNRLSREMHGLNDYMLADIGIRRDEIPLIVEKSFPRVRIMDVLAGWLDTWIETRTNRQAARELATFDDRMLADIGLGRSDISAIEKGYYPVRHLTSLPIFGTGVNGFSNTDAVNDDHQRAA
ncbi:MAG: DUF1127 domain-containing protein [Rhodospirillaceae bacterium]|jgi:uncharacterized protein YjiS (DUF1127 family)|nr:DUF1127 domain-containing protein [Rhodospirillaceae bacterium]MBT5243915.1 DUF1127 domain-containing protein [Rhodospirillaceae bacterium]MBT6241363.1 DUF1127 domain-containing protein [Rhodospirillaceae bacterium]MBT7139062.1 DUF1127 domain-containing protein [Rhodospirillaceae bacterium]